MKELELYFHIPFCERKCAYCDFLSAPADPPVRISYIRSYRKKLHIMVHNLRNIR